MNKNKLKKMALTLSLIELLSLNKYFSSKDNEPMKSIGSARDIVYNQMDIVNDKITNIRTNNVNYNLKELNKNNIYVGHDEDGKNIFLRYNEDTSTYEAISIFDEENIETSQYGANQDDFDYHFNELIKDPLIYNELQKYYPINKFSSTSSAMYFYKELFNIIADYGCGYVCVANKVFHYFEGREEEFENTFGYPMYKVNYKGDIDFNYEIFILKFFNYSINNRNYKPVNYDDIIKGLTSDKNTINSSITGNTVNPCELALPLDKSFGKVSNYLKNYGLDANAIFYKESIGSYNIDDIVASENFTLYIENSLGFKSIYKDNVPCHYIYITGYTADGMPIVSSWGEKYIFDINSGDWVSKVSLKLKK